MLLHNIGACLSGESRHTKWLQFLFGGMHSLCGAPGPSIVATLNCRQRVWIGLASVAEAHSHLSHTNECWSKKTYEWMTTFKPRHKAHIYSKLCKCRGVVTISRATATKKIILIPEQCIRLNCTFGKLMVGCAWLKCFRESYFIQIEIRDVWLKINGYILFAQFYQKQNDLNRHIPLHTSITTKP